jgi:hypothetical protein
MFILIARLLCFSDSAQIPRMIGDWVLTVAQFTPFSNAEHTVRCVSHFAAGVSNGVERFATETQFSNRFLSNA